MTHSLRNKTCLLHLVQLQIIPPHAACLFICKNNQKANRGDNDMITEAACFTETTTTQLIQSMWNIICDLICAINV